MALYDAKYYLQRLLRVFPRTWAGDYAWTPADPFYWVMYAYAQQLSNLRGKVEYWRPQLRIKTATDINLDLIAVDLFGPNYKRGTVLQGLNLIPESDAAFAKRIAYDATAPRGTVSAIQYKVTEYINNYYTAEIVSASQLLGLNSEGGLDTRGALDGRPSNLPPLPLVSVFDQQSNPVLSARVGLTAGQFCILLMYGKLARDGFWVGRSHLGRRDAHLLNGNLEVIPPLTPTLDAIVEQFKAMGTQQVYVDNRGS